MTQGFSLKSAGAESAVARSGKHASIVVEPLCPLGLWIDCVHVSGGNEITQIFGILNGYYTLWTYILCQEHNFSAISVVLHLPSQIHNGSFRLYNLLCF